MNWKDKRLKELQDMIDNGCDPDLLIDEYNGYSNHRRR